MSYQLAESSPVPWAGKSPWEINYSKKQPKKPHTKKDKAGGGSREREEGKEKSRLEVRIS